MNYASLSAKELQAEIDGMASYAEDSGELLAALHEVQRLRIICQDIVEIAHFFDPDYQTICSIEAKAQEYFMPVEESA